MVCLTILNIKWMFATWTYAMFVYIILVQVYIVECWAYEWQNDLQGINLL